MEYYNGAKILVVEDDEDLCYIMQLQLTNNGFDVDIAQNYDEIIKCIEGNQYDLVILDMMLPDTDGIEVCKRIREGSACPILFASCIVDRKTIIEALGVGGDDYIVKPIDIDLLIARIKANLRRSENYEKKSKVLKFKQFMLDTGKHAAWRVDEEGEAQEEIALSPIEYKLLLMFTERKDQLLLYDELYRGIWESDDLGDVRTVMVHVSNLRKKIDNNKTDIIHTVRGAGYIFSDV